MAWSSHSIRSLALCSCITQAHLRFLSTARPLLAGGFPKPPPIASHPRRGNCTRSGRHFDAVIIGSGVIGNSIALELARKGWRTLNVDKLEGVAQGSTSFSSGICRMMYSLEDSVKFAWEGYNFYDNWEDHIATKSEYGYATLRKCGGLVLRPATGSDYLDSVLKSYDNVGLRYEEWSNERLQSRLQFDTASYFPITRFEHDDNFGSKNGELKGGVYFPDGGYVSDPQLAARNLRDAAEATGNASFAFGKEVVAILREGGRVGGVRFADDSEESCPVVVNVAGPHSSHITSLAFPDPDENDMQLTTRAMRLEVSYLDAPPGVDWGDGGDGLFCCDLDCGIYFRPEVGGKILIGSVEPECDTPTFEYPKDPESVYPGRENAGLTEQWTNQVYRAALRMPTIPLPTATNTQGIAACYDVTEDFVPIYDRSALDGFYMAIGTSGNQFKNAVVAGRLMSEIIEACENGHDHDANPIDFELTTIPTTNKQFNTQTFSRLRLNLKTSGSVLG